MATLGQPVDRVDGRLKVTGRARYAAEFRAENLAHAVLVQSTFARGKILGIDIPPAAAAPGVLAVLTHETMPALRKAQTIEAGEDRLPLSDDVLHYAGQIVAVVVGASLEQARHAASLVRVRCQMESAVLGLADRAAAAYTPKTRHGEPREYRRGDVERALAEPADLVRIEQTYSTSATMHQPMEPSAALAVWQGERLTVYDSTQALADMRAFLAETFGLPKASVRVVSPFVGGGFGCKGSPWAHLILAASAARLLRRPVRITLSRPQMFTSVGHRPATEQSMTLAARRDGTLVAMRHATRQATAMTAEYLEGCGFATSKMLYACENVEVTHRLVRLNVPPSTTMRAPGECPGSFALESALDELADALALDPIALRLQNDAASDPAEKKPWSAKHLVECFRRGAERIGWERRSPVPGSMRGPGVRRGLGMAMASYPGYYDQASAKARLLGDGRILVQAATQDIGTGSYTIFTQVAADAFDLPIDRIAFELGDTDLPEAPGSYGSSTAASVSEAVGAAARALKTKLEQLAVALPHSPFAGAAAEAFTHAGGELALAAEPTRRLSYAALARAAGLSTIEAEAHFTPAESLASYSIQSWGAHFCEVHVDPLLPRVQVARWVAVMDVGRVLNPKTSRSQVVGGITMGIGMALMEQGVWDARTGRLPGASLESYLIPVCADVPPIEVEFLDHPDPVINTLGCRGVGEIGITGVAAAVANAVYNATGRRIRKLPITIDTLL